MFNVWDREISYKIRKEKEKQVVLRNRNRSYKNTFGIDLEEYNKLFEEQGGCCAICKKHQTLLKKRLAIDHCHKSLRIRKLLCTNCNLGLGLFKEDQKILQAAIRYLKEFKQPSGASEKPAGAFK